MNCPLEYCSIVRAATEEARTQNRESQLKIKAHQDFTYVDCVPTKLVHSLVFEREKGQRAVVLLTQPNDVGIRPAPPIATARTKSKKNALGAVSCLCANSNCYSILSCEAFMHSSPAVELKVRIADSTYNTGTHSCSPTTVTQVGLICRNRP